MTKRRLPSALILVALVLLMIGALKMLQPVIPESYSPPPCAEVGDCIAVNTVGSGRVTSTGGHCFGFTYSEGHVDYAVFLCNPGTVTLTAIPSRGWVFAGWGCSSANWGCRSHRWGAPAGGAGRGAPAGGAGRWSVTMQLANVYFATATFRRQP